MNPTVVDLTREGSERGSATQDTDESRGVHELEARLLGRVERELAQFRATVIEDVSRSVLHRIEEVVARKVGERAGGSGAGFDAPQIKDLMTDVLKASLFDSGVLEKFIERTLVRKLEAGPADGPASAALWKAAEAQMPAISQKLQAECVGAFRAEVAAIAQKEAGSALSGENLKILIDEKFRAISIYLKTDVIPKAVAQALKGSRR
jgi:hypothetical protein